jgi:predicted PurR-regulated permease PerM
MHSTTSSVKKTPNLERRDPSALQTGVLIVITALGIYLCFRIAVPFLSALAWALALAVLLVPLQRLLERKLKQPSLAAATCVAVACTVLLVTGAFVIQRLVGQTVIGVRLIQANVESGQWRHVLQGWPRTEAVVTTVEQAIDLPGTINTFAVWLSTTATSVLKGSVYQALGFFLTLYLLFFFLRDRAMALRSLNSLSPLSDARMAELYERIRNTIFANLYGTLAVSAAQGLLGGVMLWILGISAPLLWGLIMAILAVVPALGAFVVWVPAAIYLALEGSWIKSIILVCWGLVVVGTVDNLLRPVLVGKWLRLHTVLAFISVVGGLLVFGPAGLVLGPLVLTTTTFLLESWSSRSSGLGTSS